MELPNHSKQLLRQLHSLQKEHQFCDCTILIGTGQFRAHKLVLAASSSLFKSLLQDTDTVSINSSVVSPDEFMLLLEMVYSGKLPPGKHNFSRIISAADSLQMVDVAMSCMDFLANVMGQQGPKEPYNVVSQKDCGLKNILAKKNRLSHSDWNVGMPQDILSQDEIFALDSVLTPAERDGAERNRDELCVRRGRFVFPGILLLEILTFNLASIWKEREEKMAINDPWESVAIDFSERYVELERALIKEVTTFYDLKLLEKYISTNVTPRGLRVERLPAFEFSEDESDLSSEWKDISLKCTLGWLSVLVKRNERTLQKVRTSILHLQEKLIEESSVTVFNKNLVEIKNRVSKIEAEVISRKKRKYLRDVKDHDSDGEVIRREPDFSIKQDVSEAIGSSCSFLEKAEENQEVTDSEKQVTTESVSGIEGQIFSNPVEEPCGEKEVATCSDSVLDLSKDTNPCINAAVQEQSPSQIEELHIEDHKIEENSLFALLLERRDELIYSVTKLSPILECLDLNEEGFLTDYEKQVIFSCCVGESHKGAMRKLLHRVEQDKALSPDTLLRLLHHIKESFPSLKLLLEQLKRQTDKLKLEDYGTELLELNQKNIMEILQDPDLLRQGLSQTRDIPAKDRQVMEEVLNGCVDSGDISDRLSSALKKRTLSSLSVWRFLLSMRESEPTLGTLIKEIKKEPEVEQLIQADKESKAMEILMRHSKLITDAVDDVSAFRDHLTPEVEDLSEDAVELLRGCCDQENAIEPIRKILQEVLEKKSIPVLKFCAFLCSMVSTFPNLRAVCQEIEGAELLKEADAHLEVEEVTLPVNTDETLTSVVEEDSTDSRKDGDDDEAATTTRTEEKTSSWLTGRRASSSSRHNYVCSFCNRTFDYNCRLVAHLRKCRIANPRTVICEVCGENKPSKGVLRQHLREAHGITPVKKNNRVDGTGQSITSVFRRRRRSSSFPKQSYVCKFCSRKFDYNCRLLAHLKVCRIANQKPVTCEECGETKPSKSVLDWHLLVAHGVIPAKKTDESSAHQGNSGWRKRRTSPFIKQSYTCKFCSRNFDYNCRLLTHLRQCRVANQRPITCEECGETKPSKADLDRHRFEAHGITPLRRLKRRPRTVSCDICGKGFDQPSGLQYHMRTKHLEQKPFACQECGARFGANSTLKNHMRLHTGERPYYCERCNMAFTQAAALAYHNKRKHSEELLIIIKEEVKEEEEENPIEKVQTVSCEDSVIEIDDAETIDSGKDDTDNFLAGIGLEEMSFWGRRRRRSSYFFKQSYDCMFCCRSFDFKCRLIAHLRKCRIANQKPIVCEECGETKPSKAELNKHRFDVHGITPPVKCKKVEGGEGVGEDGIELKPSTGRRGRRPSTGPKISYVCTFCNRTFDYNCRLLAHLKKCRVANPITLTCKECGEMRNSKADMEAHRFEAHGIPPGTKDSQDGKTSTGRRGRRPSSAPKESYICSFCNKIFDFNCRLVVHLKKCRFANKKTVTCEECGEVKSSNSALKRHRFDVHGIRPSKKCKKANSSEDAADTQEGEKKNKWKKKSAFSSSEQVYICKYCNRSFEFNCRLVAHQKLCRIARRRLWKCRQCEETMSSMAELWRHRQKVHSIYPNKKCKKKNRPVSCDICGKCYDQSSGLEYHKRTKHFDEKPFSCEECGATFAANSTLKNHMRLHTGERPFACKHCKMSFMQAAALAYHIKKKHPEDFEHSLVKHKAIRRKKRRGWLRRRYDGRAANTVDTQESQENGTS
ncbi:zinc finger and BTB domain-containing protein 40-like [Protopterus annectens]|uniref:zinc finger and BTB domain-containing protein 40-like n=1 Tax=Protopterus annectens TaxID=7888 RepID=UPI001CF94B4A|nr:zinc finger and BTB domain-containing protein 40-like [Protopterus annectens]